MLSWEAGKVGGLGSVRRRRLELAGLPRQPGSAASCTRQVSTAAHSGAAEGSSQMEDRAEDRHSPGTEGIQGGRRESFVRAHHPPRKDKWLMWVCLKDITDSSSLF